MKLIFKEAEFQEIYIDEYLPFLDRDTRFSYMKPHIISAQKEIIKIIGESSFAIAVNAFDSKATTELESEILYHFRLPILLYAYKLYAPTNDLRHGNNGRKMTNKEDESNPFEWMINRDNINQERSHYREVDNLIYFLSKFKVWRDSETYKRSRRLFVHSTSVFDEHFPVNSRLLLLKLEPGLKQAERKHIKPIIGNVLFARLKVFLLQTESDTLEYYPKTAPVVEPVEDPNFISLEPLEKEVLNLCEEACVYFSLAWAMKRLKVTLFPEGLLQSYVGDRQTSSAKKTPENLETQLAAQEFTKDAEDVLLLIQNILSEMQIETTEDINDLSDFNLNTGVNHESDDKFFTI